MVPIGAAFSFGKYLLKVNMGQIYVYGREIQTEKWFEE